MIEGALEIGAAAEQDAAKQLEELTDGEVDKATRRGAFKQWLRGEGVAIPTKLAKQIDAEGEEELVEKETIDAEHLRGVIAEAGLPDHVERAIRIWLAVNKASTKKYRAMLNRLGADDRVREVLRYRAASPGRWGGAGIQPQNLPRNCPGPEEMEKVCQDLRTGDYELIRILYGQDEVMPLLSRALRGAITAAPGHRLIVADYSAIEARGTFWVSGHDEGLKAFRKIDSGAWPGHDIYTWQATKILLREVTKEDKNDRQVWGKVPVLGCGYQMGPPKLVDYAASMGAEITEDQAQKIVYAYRRDHWPVKEFWYEAERCAIEAVRRGNGGDVVSMAGGKIKWAVRGAFLHCRLPSGRLLSYFRPKVEWDKKFGRPKLTFLGHATYKPGLWTRCSTYGGKLTENIVQALCRDIMRDAMLRARAAGYPIVLTVHDEIAAEAPHGEGSLEEFERLLSQAPSWADGFPIAVEGWERERYGKD